MDLHEYQAKELLQEAGIPIPPQVVIDTLDQIESLDQTSGVIKAQVHAGGRGKGGGVKLAKTRQELISHAKKMLGMSLVTPQTTQEGVVVRKLIISPLCEIEKEYYIGAIIDREKAESILIASPDGGIEIEEVAAKTPERILKLPITLEGKIRSYHLLRLAKFMGWDGQTAKQGMQIAAALAKVFVSTDASLLEINPLVKTPNGDLVALDAKLSVDDNALFRQPRIKAFYDPTQLPKNEVEAKAHDLAYVALDGSIGCMVNGAGLAMATMDLIQYHGGKPANFLDVGGGADEEKVKEGFKILLSDDKVKAILVNIFGGIMNCATIAQGIISAVNEFGVKVPLIVRMEGTNVETGKKLLSESGLNIIVAKDLTEAAKKATGAVNGNLGG